jgi:hypothetical protein
VKRPQKTSIVTILKLAFENPEIAIAHRCNNAQEEKYQWFVAFLLTSCDEIVRILPRDKTWRQGICIDLKPHLAYFGSDAFREDGGWGLYSPELKIIAAEAGLKD